MSNKLLIIFTRNPEPGKVKTRLIPVLGEKGAADLHRAMAFHTVKVAKQLAEKYQVSLEIHYDGGNLESVKADLDIVPGIRYIRQSVGNLGKRMNKSFGSAFNRSHAMVILIGTDCPQITANLLKKAFDLLELSDCVIGPAKDGGYYLIGLKKPCPELFEDIKWGSGTVFKQTMHKIKDLGLLVAQTKKLVDVDRPEDLSVWDKVKQATAGEKISVIIPTLNEAERLRKTLDSLRDATNTEIIVADGGSQDNSRQIAEEYGAIFIATKPGRAAQLNSGAAQATGTILFFLHADSTPPQGFVDDIKTALKDPSTIAGAFSLRFDTDSFVIRRIARNANARSKRLMLPYGDQGLFLRVATFRTEGGFPEIELMDDFKFMWELQKKGTIVTLPSCVTTSARRFEKLGVARTTLINQLVLLGYYLGVQPSDLAHFYRSENPHVRQWLSLILASWWKNILWRAGK